MSDILPMGPEMMPVYYALGVALAVYCLAFTLPGTSTTHLNWNHIENVLINSSNQALQLIPALSAVVIPSTSPYTYAAIGLTLWFLGLGVTNIPAPGCRAVPTTCTKTDKAVLNLGIGFQTAGVSFLAGSLVAYMKSQL